MKMKFVRNGHTNRRELIVASQKGETLDTKRADKLADDPSALLLGFSYESQRGNALLHYDVEGLWSLRTYLAKRAMGQEELMGLLDATERVLDICHEHRLSAEGLLFDPEYVFVDAQCCPHFALIVLDDVPFQARNSPLALLRAISDTEHLRFATPDAAGLGRRVGELVVDLEGVFSGNKFRRFLEDERHQGDASLPEARHSVVESGTSSVWASAGGGVQTSAAKDDGSFFWSPLSGIARGEDPEPTKAQWAQAGQPPAQPQGSSASKEVDGASAAPEHAAPAEGAAAAVTPAPSAPAEPLQPKLSRPASAASANVAPQAQPVAQAPSAPAMPPVSQPAVQAGVGSMWLVRPATGERFELPLGQQVQVGRGSACAIRLLGNRKLSRVHAVLTHTGQMVMVSDAGATNGVYVGGQRIGPLQSVLVTPGQKLRLADEEFVVVMG